MFKNINGFISDIVNKNQESRELLNSYRDFLRSKNSAQARFVAKLVQSGTREPLKKMTRKTFELGKQGEIRNESRVIKWVENLETDIPSYDFKLSWFDSSLPQGDVKRQFQIVSFNADVDQLNIPNLEDILYTTTKMGFSKEDFETVSVLSNGKLAYHASIMTGQFIQSELDIPVSVHDSMTTFGQAGDLDKTVTNIIESYQNNVIVDAALESLNEISDSFTLNFADVSASVSHRLGELTAGSNAFMVTVNEILRTEGYSVMDRISSITGLFSKTVDDFQSRGFDAFSDYVGSSDDYSGASPMYGWVSNLDIDFSKTGSAIVSALKAPILVQMKVLKGIGRLTTKAFNFTKSKIVETFVDPIDFIVNKERKFDELIDVFDPIKVMKKKDIIDSGLMTEEEIDIVVRRDSATDIILPFGRITIGKDENDDIVMAHFITPTVPIGDLSLVTNKRYFLPGIYVDGPFAPTTLSASGFKNIKEALDTLFPPGQDNYIPDHEIQDDGYWLDCIVASKLRMSYFMAILRIRTVIVRQRILPQDIPDIDASIFSDIANYDFVAEALGYGSSESFITEFFPSVLKSSESDDRFMLPLYREYYYGPVGQDKFSKYEMEIKDNGYYAPIFNKGSKTTNKDLVDAIIGSNGDSIYGEHFGVEILISLLLQSEEQMYLLMSSNSQPIFLPFVRRRKEYKFKYSIATDGKHIGRINKVLIGIVIATVVVVAGVAAVKLTNSIKRSQLTRQIEVDRAITRLKYTSPDTPGYQQGILELQRMKRKQLRFDKLSSMIGIPGITSVNSVVPDLDIRSPFRMDNSDILESFKNGNESTNQDIKLLKTAIRDLENKITSLTDLIK